MESEPEPKRDFLAVFAILVLFGNSILFMWALHPDSIGGYVVLFAGTPLNLMLGLYGLIRVGLFHRKKLPINLTKHYLAVLFLPLIAQIIVAYLVQLFGRPGGC